MADAVDIFDAVHMLLLFILGGSFSDSIPQSREKSQVPRHIFGKKRVDARRFVLQKEFFEKSKKTIDKAKKV